MRAADHGDGDGVEVPRDRNGGAPRRFGFLMREFRVRPGKKIVLVSRGGEGRGGEGIKLEQLKNDNVMANFVVLFNYFSLLK